MIASGPVNSGRLQPMLDRTSRFSLQDKRALVTGASRGIGAEIATVFADAGADVAIVGETQRACKRRGKRSPARVAGASRFRRTWGQSMARAPPAPGLSSSSEPWTFS